MRIHSMVCWLLSFLFCMTGIVAHAEEPTAREIFERRIAPIFRSPNPSSCVQCHLGGVDRKHYILPSSDKTFLSLRDQGLIDFENPNNSKILRPIRMGDKETGPATMVHEKARKQEYEAFAAWIKVCCEDQRLRKADKIAAEEQAKPARPVEVIRHARKDRLLDSFERNVWAMRFRCMNCHTEGTAQSEKLRKEHGDRVIWVKRGGPQETMDYLLSSKIIDVKSPEKSLLLRKPLGEIEHGGGKKFLMGDQGYKAFRAWIEDVAAIRNDRYVKAADLPPRETGPLQFGSEIWLKLTNTPDAWDNRLLQVTLHAWDRDKAAWEAAPIATSDRLVNGKGKIWQHTLTLFAVADSKRAEEWKRGKAMLAPGRYLVKVHVDREERLSKDWKATMSKDDFAGETSLEVRWREGYGGMTVLDARNVKTK